MPANSFFNFPNGGKMPAIGLGTYDAKDEGELEQAIDAALEAGYRHIDTAYVYENEKLIGNILKKWFTSGKLKRQELFITTKLPLMAMQPDRVETFMKKSLENLQLDYVDLYLIHFPVGTNYDEAAGKMAMNAKGDLELQGRTDHTGIWKKMEEQVDAGRTKAIGLSNYNIAQIEIISKSAIIQPSCLQVELHVYLQQRELVDFCKKRNIVVVAYSPLGSPGHNNTLRKLGKEKELPNILGDATIAQLAKKYKKSPAQIALRFLLQRGLVAIPKSITPKRLQENIDVFDFEINAADFKSLMDLEVGESARVCDFVAFTGFCDHPDFPF